MSRPRKYDKAWQDKAVALGKQGASLAEIACELKISRQTLWRECERNEAFRNAIEESKLYAQAYLERAAVEGAMGINKDINGPLLLKVLQCRFPEHWTPTSHYQVDKTVNVTDARDTLRDKINSIGKRNDVLGITSDAEIDQD